MRLLWVAGDVRSSLILARSSDSCHQFISLFAAGAASRGDVSREDAPGCDDNGDRGRLPQEACIAVDTVLPKGFLTADLSHAPKRRPDSLQIVRPWRQRRRRRWGGRSVPGEVSVGRCLDGCQSVRAPCRHAAPGPSAAGSKCCCALCDACAVAQLGDCMSLGVYKHHLSLDSRRLSSKRISECVAVNSTQASTLSTNSDEDRANRRRK